MASKKGIMLLAAAGLLSVMMVGVTLVRGSGARLETPDTYSLKDGFVSHSNTFAIKLFREFAKDGNNMNIFFSPLSITSALGMTSLGARGKTAEQMHQAMVWQEMTSEEAHQSLKALSNLLKTTETDPYILSEANKLFIQKDFKVLQDFMQKTSQFYGAEAKQVDFVSKSEETRNMINAWVANQTAHKIKDLIPPNVLNAMTRLVLVNAIYFKGRWASQFETKFTQKLPFYSTPDDKGGAKVDMMFQKGDFYYADLSRKTNLNAQMLELPYVGKRLKMTILLPQTREGLPQLERDLDPSQLHKLSSFAKNTTVRIQLPRFKMTETYDLVKHLSHLGITDLFSSHDADLSGVDGSKQLSVSAAIHKAFIEVNEEGTEAAAATSMIMQARSGPIDPTFRADHPFLFLIQDISTGAVVFAGRVVQPSTDNGRDEL